MLGRSNWKARALEAETKLQACKEMLEGMDLRFKDRAALMSIVRNGRNIRLGFVRNDEVHWIEFYGTWEHDVDMWKRVLLGRNGGNE